MVELGEEGGRDLFEGEGGARVYAAWYASGPSRSAIGAAVRSTWGRCGRGDNVGLDDAGAGRGEAVVAEAGEDGDGTFNC